MPGQVIDKPNPAALPSRLPKELDSLRAKIEKKGLSDDDARGLKQWQAAACYLAAAMIFLRDNALLEKDLSFDDIKPRLLGHWGTCPGLAVVYSHINLVIRDHDLEMIFVVGPGHGAPAILAGLWLEGSLARFYPNEYTVDKQGLHNLVTRFSVPGSFPSHINSETPGAIHEGGELGYALAVSFGAVMDNPDLIVTCVVGDGEAETGPTATAWHSIKYLDPAESGAVIPILHVNGFKISERTIFGCMDDLELLTLFTGYGYQVAIVENLERIDEELHDAMEWAVAEIKEIQRKARQGEAVVKPRWPMIVLKTPKGWTGPKELDGEIIEGSFNSHQVPLPKAKEDEAQLGELASWLKGYHPEKVLPGGKPAEGAMRIIPEQKDLRVGQVKKTYDPYIGLDLPDWKPFCAKKGDKDSSMKITGEFLGRVIEQNPSTLRLFSPDELESNKLSGVLAKTGRNFQWDQFSRAKGGRVIEVLSEHCCQGFMQGYTLTGRTALFPSYESFLGIIHTMMVQYAKFTKIGREVGWRGPLSSVNYVETSTWARQEHNGFSHQNPSFIGAVLNVKAEAARVYLPPDANCLLSTMHHCLKSKNYINLIIGSKQPMPILLTPEEAEQHCKKGASILPFASSPLESTALPDVVLVGIGVEVTFETIKAAEILREVCPELKIRTVNVTDLMVLAEEGGHPHALDNGAWEEMFTKDREVCWNYHGYGGELWGLLGGRGRGGMSVEGYKEEGSTTTPFDMMLVNRVSRFHVASRALNGGARFNDAVAKRLTELLAMVDERMEGVKQYITENGKDPDDCYAMPKFGD